ncbi:MAG: Abi family protein [Proteobacteria bacterium]|nr:Abi family protein [Pseudomonadota bacterium]MCL2308076.1 Abi family protein [Pseudomonadota bacterium]
MEYSKPPLPIDDQLALLKQRGMLFNDESVARNTLEHINYYRLRAYWLPFEIPSGDTFDRNHRFKEGTCFEHVLAYYTFDQRLKLLLIDAIERIEISLRTRFSLELGLKYGSHAHAESALFKKAEVHSRCLESLEEEMGRSKEVFIKHYIETYDRPRFPPVWVSCEIMPLGILSKWIDNLKKREDKKLIARIYGFNEEIICSFLHHLSTVRNLCAHHARVWDRRFTIRMKIPRHSSTAGFFARQENDNRIYNTLLMLKLMLDKICPDSSWKDRLLQLIDRMPEKTASSMGFPDGWRSFSVWR